MNAKLVQIDRELAVMGTQLEVSVSAPTRAAALLASEVAVIAVEQAEKRLSTWRPHSELSAVNQGSAPTPQLAAELAAANHWASVTGGAFQPRAAALISAWDLRGKGRIPSAAELRIATADHTRWEEGGFGKGAALHAALEKLGETTASRAVLNLGGQIAVLPSTEITIQVSHPRDRHTPIAEFKVDHGSVATSGNSEKNRIIDGRNIGHLLDPRTGQPALDFGSVTVWAPTAIDADCLSTGLFVLGPDAAMKWALQQSQAEVLILIDSPTGLQMRATPKLAEQLRMRTTIHTPQNQSLKVQVQ